MSIIMHYTESLYFHLRYDACNRDMESELSDKTFKPQKKNASLSIVNYIIARRGLWHDWVCPLGSRSRGHTSSIVDCSSGSPPRESLGPHAPRGTYCGSRRPRSTSPGGTAGEHATGPRINHRSGAAAWNASHAALAESGDHSRRQHPLKMKPTLPCEAWHHRPQQWRAWSEIRRRESVCTLSSPSSRRMSYQRPPSSHWGTY